MGKRGNRASKKSNSRNSSNSDPDILSWGSSMLPESEQPVQHVPRVIPKKNRRKTYYIKNMKLQMTFFPNEHILQVEISDRYIAGINYDHRFKMASANTFDEMENVIYLLSIFFGDTPIPKEEWISELQPRNGQHDFQYREAPVDFRSVNEEPRRILFRGAIFQELTPSYPPLSKAIAPTPMGKGKGKP